MTVAFMASDAVAIPAMEALYKKGLLACLVSNADKPKGRGKILSPNPAAAWALSKDIPVLRPEKTPGGECIDWMKPFNIDCIIVMAYGKILRDEILNFPKLGCLNLHASILPHLRGASPIETAIAIGDTQTGVSLMRVAKKMDSGDVGAAISTPISERETGASLREKIAADAAKLLAENLFAIESSSLSFIPQNESDATYARKITKADMFLDFSKSAFELDCRIRAFGGGYVPWRGGRLKFCEAFCDCACHNETFGKIISADYDSLKIACGEGVLHVRRLQAPCAKSMRVADFLCGCKIYAGDILESSQNLPLLRK